MRIVPQSINQNTQLNNRKSNVNFGLKISPEYGAALVEDMFKGFPYIGQTLQWRRYLNRSLSCTQRFVSACEKDEKHNPNKQWVFKGLHLDSEGTYIPDIVGAPAEEIQKLSVDADEHAFDGDLALLKFTEKLEKQSGIRPREDQYVDDKGYGSVVKGIFTKISKLIAEPNNGVRR